MLSRFIYIKFAALMSLLSASKVNADGRRKSSAQRAASVGTTLTAADLDASGVVRLMRREGGLEQMSAASRDLLDSDDRDDSKFKSEVGSGKKCFDICAPGFNAGLYPAAEGSLKLKISRWCDKKSNGYKVTAESPSFQGLPPDCGTDDKCQNVLAQAQCLTESKNTWNANSSVCTDPDGKTKWNEMVANYEWRGVCLPDVTFRFSTSRSFTSSNSTGNSTTTPQVDLFSAFKDLDNENCVDSNTENWIANGGNKTYLKVMSPCVKPRVGTCVPGRQGKIVCAEYSEFNYADFNASLREHWKHYFGEHRCTGDCEPHSGCKMIKFKDDAQYPMYIHGYHCGPFKHLHNDDCSNGDDGHKTYRKVFSPCTPGCENHNNVRTIHPVCGKEGVCVVGALGAKKPACAYFANNTYADIEKVMGATKLAALLKSYGKACNASCEPMGCKKITFKDGAEHLLYSPYHICGAWREADNDGCTVTTGNVSGREADNDGCTVTTGNVSGRGAKAYLPFAKPCKLPNGGLCVPHVSYPTSKKTICAHFSTSSFADFSNLLGPYWTTFMNWHKTLCPPGQPDCSDTADGGGTCREFATKDGASVAVAFEQQKACSNESSSFFGESKNAAWHTCGPSAVLFVAVLLLVRGESI
eukprot:gnl/TRDRNA2_/TRDRNA2_152760_c0_seq1.p1 gnl/TRDRNA2_/TRDRNA2_152760_c0~~gnl/TRDRNA2_/TRDRNA2_152760_c0_seq1.p1  ORF type:complete len:641 (-),score=87.40 gnl/TRDRNA2_/TRDRNA2_152760_c0_seq1:44-1966(-)